MKRVIVDTSVSVKWLIAQNEQLTECADALLRDAQSEKVELFAPELSKFEIGNVLWKRAITGETAEALLSTFYYLPILFFVETRERAQRTLSLAHQHKITYYDASFLSLAEELDAAVVTDNPKHLARGKSTQVIALKDYVFQKIR